MTWPVGCVALGGQGAQKPEGKKASALGVYGAGCGGEHNSGYVGDWEVWESCGVHHTSRLTKESRSLHESWPGPHPPRLGTHHPFTRSRSTPPHKHTPQKRQLLITVGSEEPGCSSTTVKLWPAEKLLAAAAALAAGSGGAAGSGSGSGGHTAGGGGGASATGAAPLAAAASAMSAAKVTKVGVRACVCL